MNIFFKAYCRVFQTCFRIALPILPYKDPKVLKSQEEIANVLISNGKKKPIIVTDSMLVKIGSLNNLFESLENNNIKYTVFDEVVVNPTTDSIEKCLDIFKLNGCDSIIAFGGGSSMDTAKALGARVARPKKNLNQLAGILKVMKKIPLLICVPTTCGTGSEATLASVVTDSVTRHKYAINDFPLIPSYACLDYRVIKTLPTHLVSTTALDALTHALEAFIGRSTTKQTRQDSLDAIKLIFENVIDGALNHSDKALENLLVASFKAGKAFSKSYVGYVHALAHPLGGKYNTPHGLANSVILPIVLEEYNTAIEKKLAKVYDYCNLGDETSQRTKSQYVIGLIKDIERKLSIPEVLDVKEEDFEELANYAYHEANPLYPVPVLWSKKKLIEMYKKIKG